MARSKEQQARIDQLLAERRTGLVVPRNHAIRRQVKSDFETNGGPQTHEEHDLYGSLVTIYGDRPPRIYPPTRVDDELEAARSNNNALTAELRKKNEITLEGAREVELCTGGGHVILLSGQRIYTGLRPEGAPVRKTTPTELARIQTAADQALEQELECRRRWQRARAEVVRLEGIQAQLRIEAEQT